MQKKFARLLQQKEIQKLVKNFLSLSVVQIIQLLTPILIVPFLITKIGVSQYGNITFIFSIVAYFFSVTDYSFKVSGTREISLNLHRPELIANIIKNTIIVKGVMVVSSMIVIFGITFIYPPLQKQYEILWFGILMLLGYACSTEWYFLGTQNTQLYAITQVISKLLFLGGCVLLINEPKDYLIYPILLSSTTFIGNFLLLIIMIRKHKVNLKKWSIVELKLTLQQNFPLFINQFIPNLYNNSGIVMIGLVTSSTQVGLYDIIKKPVDLVTTLISVLSKSIFPFMNRKNSSFEAYRKGILLLTTLFFILCLIGTIPFFQFLNIPTTTRYFVTYFLLISSMFGYVLYDCYGVNYLIIRNKDRIVMKNTIKASLIAFLLIFPMVYFWGCVGAALNILLARFMMGVGLMYQKHKLNDIKN